MKRATIIDVANYAGVSTATVSRVLNREQFVSEDLKQQVMKAIKDLNYVSNTMARNLKTQTSNQIGVVVPDLSNQYYMKIVKGIEDIFATKGYVLYLAGSNGSAERETQILKNMYENRVRSIVLATTGNNNESVKEIVDLNQHVILIDRKMGDDVNLDYIVEDNYRGAYEMTENLCKKGFKKIAVITGLNYTSVGEERLQGSRDALKKYDLEPLYIYEGDYSQESGQEAMKYFKTQTEEAEVIISMNNTMTVGVLKELFSEVNESHWEDVKIASYGEFEFQEMFGDRIITYVSQEPYKIGERVANLLLDYYEDEENHQIVQEQLEFEVNI